MGSPKFLDCEGAIEELEQETARCRSDAPREPVASRKELNPAVDLPGAVASHMHGEVVRRRTFQRAKTAI